MDVNVPSSSGRCEVEQPSTTAANEDLLSAIRRESPQDASTFHNCNFRVLSQFVSINDVDFKERSFSLFTELSLAPLHPELRQICLNIGPGQLFLFIEMLLFGIFCYFRGVFSVCLISD